MHTLNTILVFCGGAIFAWGICSWCTRSTSATALKVRQVLNLGGPDGPGDGPP